MIKKRKQEVPLLTCCLLQTQVTWCKDASLWPERELHRHLEDQVSGQSLTDSVKLWTSDWHSNWSEISRRYFTRQVIDMKMKTKRLFYFKHQKQLQLWSRVRGTLMSWINMKYWVSPETWSSDCCFLWSFFTLSFVQFFCSVNMSPCVFIWTVCQQRYP